MLSSWPLGKILTGPVHYGMTLHTFNFQFMDPLSSFSVGYKSESNDANDSKKEDLSQIFEQIKATRIKPLHFTN